MFESHTSLLEIVARVLLVYFALLLMVRLSGKREIGELGPMDLLAMLLLSETVSPALTRQDTSISAGLTAAATLLTATFVVDWVTHRSGAVERWIEGRPLVVIEHGRVRHALLKRLRISDEELATALREQGLEAPADVLKAVVETTGRITVIPNKRRT